MKIISYSDLHLEFGVNIHPNNNADLMILAGDIITFKNFFPLKNFLHNWKKPVLYVTGNHEYYTSQAMEKGDVEFKSWLLESLPNVILLQNESITIGDIHFFGGTMWTDFCGNNNQMMVSAKQQMNDYRFIMKTNKQILQPYDTIDFHEIFKKKLLKWLNKSLNGPRVIITHHAPVINPNTRYKNSILEGAFNSSDMFTIIEKYQPRLWVYGHTHECDDHMIGKTQIISNQLGYYRYNGNYECMNFDPLGIPIDL